MENLITIDNQEFNLDKENATFFATQEQIAKLFEVDRTVVVKHLKNIFESGELDKNSNVQKMHNTFKPTYLFSFDCIIAVGYRVNSSKATQFRIKATQILKEYFMTGEVKKKEYSKLEIARMLVESELEKEKLAIENQEHKQTIETQNNTINLISNTQDSYGIQEASKRLMVKQKDLISFLRDKKWIMHRKDENGDVKIYPQAAAENVGFAKIVSVINQKQKICYPQFRITKKGMDYLIKKRDQITANDLKKPMPPIKNPPSQPSTKLS